MGVLGSFELQKPYPRYVFMSKIMHWAVQNQNSSNVQLYTENEELANSLIILEYYIPSNLGSIMENYPKPRISIKIGEIQILSFIVNPKSTRSYTKDIIYNHI